MFPEAAESIDLDIEEDEAIDIEDSNYKDIFYFDFEKGDLELENGRLKLINNKDALKNMICKLIKTEKFIADIYAKEDDDEEFGIIIEGLIGNSYSDSFSLEYIKGNIEIEILKLKGVDSITNITVEKINDNLKIEFTVNQQIGISEVI